MARGRKPTGKTPVRQVGRISHESWWTIQQGFQKSGSKRFTNWAEKYLLAAAKREIRAFEKSNRSIKKLAKQAK